MPKRTTIYSYNRKQYANPNIYDLSESSVDGNVIRLDVISNDTLPRKGGLTLHSVDDGQGNTATDLLTPDALLSSITAPDDQWETTANGNLIGILDNTILFKPTTGFMGVTNIDDLTMNDVLTDSFTYAVRLIDNSLSWSTVTITLRGEGPDAADDGGMMLTENEGFNFNVLSNDTFLSDASILSIGAPTLLVNGQPGLNYLENQPGAFTLSGNSIQFNPGNALDPLGPGDTAQIFVNYVMTDASGQTSSATLSFQVTGELESVRGGSNDDYLFTLYSGELRGLEGNDTLQNLVSSPSGIVLFYGGAGSDTLIGGQGFDEIHMDAPWSDGSIDKFLGMDFSRDVIVLDSYQFTGLVTTFNHQLVDNNYREVGSYVPGETGIFYGPDLSAGAMLDGVALYYASNSTNWTLTQFASVDATGSKSLSFDDFYVV